MINLKNIIKKIIAFSFVMLLILIPFCSYADDTPQPDLSIDKSRYIYHTGSTWDYGIKVVVPGTYKVEVKATNSAESDLEDKNFEMYLDSVKVVDGTKVPWNEDKTETKLSFNITFSVGKHLLTIKSIGGSWDFSGIDLTLSEATNSGGNTVPGTISFSNHSGINGCSISGGNMYMNPGNFATYKLNVGDSGSYKIKFSGKFDGTDGNRIVVRMDSAELTTIQHDIVTYDYIEVSANVDLPKGTHYLELYNDDGHYDLSSFAISLNSKKEIDPVERLTKSEYESNINYVTGSDTSEEGGLSIEDASKRISDGMEGIIGTFSRIFFSLVQPIIEIFTTLLQKMLTEQSGLIEKLVLLYIDYITLWTRMWMFELLLILLRVIDALMNIFDIFAGTKYILVDNTKTIFINMLFENSTIKRVFWGIFILGIALNLIFSIISVIRGMFSTDSEKALGPMIGQIIKSFMTYAVVPIFVIICINLSSAVLLKIDDIMVLGAEGNELTFGNTLFMILSFGEETEDYEYCSENPSFKDDARSTFYNDNTKYERSSNTSAYFEFSYLKVLAGTILSIYIILLLALAIIMFVTRIFDLILLFLVSPYFAASISLDGGERFADWRKLFIAKLVSGFGLVIMMKLFVGIILPLVTNGTIVFSTNTFINSGFIILILTAGCYAVFKSHNLLMKLIDPQSALAEMGIAEVAVGAAKEVANMVKSEASGGASKAAPKGGGLSNEQKDILSK